jgi:hypothetical protein
MTKQTTRQQQQHHHQPKHTPSPRTPHLQVPVAVAKPHILELLQLRREARRRVRHRHRRDPWHGRRHRGTSTEQGREIGHPTGGACAGHAAGGRGQEAHLLHLEHCPHGAGVRRLLDVLWFVFLWVALGGGYFIFILFF